MVLIGVSAPSFMPRLDANIVAVSLPSIAPSLHANFAGIEWGVITAKHANCLSLRSAPQRGRQWAKPAR